jgi:hypothetical protein
MKACVIARPPVTRRGATPLCGTIRSPSRKVWHAASPCSAVSDRYGRGYSSALIGAVRRECRCGFTGRRPSSLRCSSAAVKAWRFNGEPRRAVTVGSRRAPGHIVVRVRWQASSHARQASAQILQCSCLAACRSHSSAHHAACGDTRVEHRADDHFVRAGATIP